jgi:CheY-like chemotaxis protein
VVDAHVLESNHTAESGKHPPCVLVVDDTPALLDVVREALESVSMQVLTCLQSKDALALVREHHPDVIMLDVVMPEVSGWQILDQLRADPVLARIPVIICTAYVEEALGRLADLQGPGRERDIGLLPKPFDIEELIEVVSSVAATTTRSQL